MYKIYFMQIRKDLLIEELLLITENAAATAKKFKELDNTRLNFKKDPASWSILECVEHLNRYGDFYLPEMEKKILENKNKHSSGLFHSGILGNYFAKLMKGKNGKIKKMKTPGNKNPAGSSLSITTIDRFLKQLDLLKALLNQARGVDLTKVTCAISLTRFIKLRLGDTFRFYVYHIERHMLQAERVREQQKEAVRKTGSLQYA